MGFPSTAVLLHEADQCETKAHALLEQAGTLRQHAAMFVRVNRKIIGKPLTLHLSTALLRVLGAPSYGSDAPTLQLWLLPTLRGAMQRGLQLWLHQPADETAVRRAVSLEPRGGGRIAAGHLAAGFPFEDGRYRAILLHRGTEVVGAEIRPDTQ